jgi:hypothetical protein
MSDDFTEGNAGRDAEALSVGEQALSPQCKQALRPWSR